MGDLATANVVKCSKEKTEADEAKAKQSEKVNKAEGEQKQKNKADKAEKAAKTKDTEAKENTNAQKNKQTLACEGVVEKGAKNAKEGAAKTKAAEASAEGLAKTQEKMKQAKLEKGSKFDAKAKANGILLKDTKKATEEIAKLETEIAQAAKGEAKDAMVQNLEEMKAQASKKLAELH